MAHTAKQSNGILEITLEGTVVEADIKALEKSMEAALESTEVLGVVFDITRWNDITEDAIREDIGFELAMLGKLDQIGNIALVSDKQWAAAVVRLLGPWVPGMEIATFRSGQEREARAFAGKSASRKPAAEGSGIRFVTTSDGLISFEIDGKVRDKDIDRIMADFDAAIAGQEDVRMLAHIKNFDGFEPSVLVHDGLLSFKVKAARKVSRYAIVNAPVWMKPFASVGELFFPGLDIAFFDDLEEARKWLKA